MLKQPAERDFVSKAHRGGLGPAGGNRCEPSNCDREHFSPADEAKAYWHPVDHVRASRKEIPGDEKAAVCCVNFFAHAHATDISSLDRTNIFFSGEHFPFRPEKTHAIFHCLTATIMIVEIIAGYFFNQCIDRRNAGPWNITSRAICSCGPVAYSFWTPATRADERFSRLATGVKGGKVLGGLTQRNCLSGIALVPSPENPSTDWITASVILCVRQIFLFAAPGLA